MTTDLLFRQDAYLREAQCEVVGHTAEGALIVDRSVFYATGGGQPGDSGIVVWEGGRMAIATTIKLDGGWIGLVPAEAVAMPAAGTALRQMIDWDRRYKHMRMHTALHLLSVAIPLPVTGGQIGAERGRLDFDMPEPLDSPEALHDMLNAMIDRDLPVETDWISEDELLSNPGLVKTMSVMPPLGQGRIRLVRIGHAAAPLDLQPCGGTHVARTGEIGRIDLGRIENKGRQNRRVSISLVD